jgi:hypothetical protein
MDDHFPSTDLSTYDNQTFLYLSEFITFVFDLLQLLYIRRIIILNSKANVFVHYKPLDHDENNRLDHEAQNNNNGNIFKRGSSIVAAMKERYHRISGHEQHNHDQDAIDKHLQDIDSEAEDQFLAENAAAAAAALPRDEGYKFNPNGD